MNVDGDVTRALVALASANAYGTVAFHLDVHVSGGYVDIAGTVMHEGYPAGVSEVSGVHAAARHDINISAAYINLNGACTPMDTKNAVEMSSAADIDVDIPGINGEVTC